MSLLTDLLKEVPLSAVLQERIKGLETENKQLKEALATVTKERDDVTNERDELRRKIDNAPFAAAPPKEKPEIRNGLYYFDGDMSKPCCPRCYENHGRKSPMAGRSHLGMKCSVCGNFIPR
jgi:hypothetical protein